MKWVIGYYTVTTEWIVGYSIMVLVALVIAVFMVRLGIRIMQALTFSMILP